MYLAEVWTVQVCLFWLNSYPDFCWKILLQELLSFMSNENKDKSISLVSKSKKAKLMLERWKVESHFCCLSLSIRHFKLQFIKCQQEGIKSLRHQQKEICLSKDWLCHSPFLTLMVSVYSHRKLNFIYLEAKTKAWCLQCLRRCPIFQPLQQSSHTLCYITCAFFIVVGV